jgi:DNA polymerase-3 subunit epsilon
MNHPSKLLLIDCETTGTDPEKDQLCEIGAILFSVQHRAVIQQLSFLFSVESNAAQNINGIDPGLTTSTQANRYALAVLADMATEADAFVAHNADFDSQWVCGFLPEKPWICTCRGISWAGLRPSPSLANLALAHGVPVWAAHRALTDCIYLAQILERDKELDSHLEEGLLPRRLVKACVSFADKNLAKDAGFRWIPELKQWHRTCNQQQIDSFPFPVRDVDA